MSEGSPKDREHPRHPKLGPSGVFRIAIAVLAGLAIGFGVGYFNGARAVSSVKRQAAAEQAQVQRDILTCRTRSDGLRRSMLALEAYRRLSIALVELETRNFGNAEKALHLAGRLLVAAGTEGDLGQLAGVLSSTRLTATDALEPQRTQLTSWLKRVDGSLPASPLGI